MDIKLVTMETWQVIRTALYELGGPYTDVIGLTLLGIILAALIVKFIIVPLRR